MLSVLPTALVALIFALPVFAEPTSPNDPFRFLALQAPKPPSPPICCLKPLTPLEPVDDGILLSFEEWKARQLAGQTDSTAKLTEDGGNQSSGGAGGDSGGEAGSQKPTSPPPPDTPIVPASPNTKGAPSGQWTGLSPHFRVPLTDRFNYANLDCSSRVHTSHRSAKSPASILSSKKDRYMLSPCKNKEEKFVVVELCDDVRIDTVQLANYEFFSGVFKDFTVSVAKTYNTDPDGWTHAGTYRAKNVRGVQSFHPPLSLRDFYRFIRIDFQSHYGSEYYCPVSLLRVYGLTHLEEWKWDIWEAESRAKQLEAEKGRQPLLASQVVLEAIKSSTLVVPASRFAPDNGTHSVKVVHASTAMPHSANDIKDQVPSSELHSRPPQPSIPYAEPATPSPPANAQAEARPPSANDHHEIPSNENLPIHSTDTHISSAVHISSIPPASKTSHQASSSIPVPPTESVPHTYPNVTANSTSVTTPGTSTIIASSSSPSASVPVAPPPIPPSIKGGESIYRTITNRLIAIESNHTLYTRYIEQQHSTLRDVIKRLGEDIGRLEGISRAQTLMHQRTVDDWERQRYQLQMEYGDLRSRIENLSEEVILEKRLGVAQLCLLLAVLVFLGLTRGSNVEALVDRPDPFNMREWGRRHLSLSGDWANRFKGKRSSSKNDMRQRKTPPPTARPKPVSAKTDLSYPKYDENYPGIAFPSGREPLENIYLNTAPVGGEFHRHTRTTSNPRSRAPSLRSTPVRRRAQHPHGSQPKPGTPTRSALRAPALQRSSSQGGLLSYHAAPWGSGSGHIPNSAKKWARTAHLHPARSAAPSSPSRSRPGSQSRDREGVFDFEQENEELLVVPRLESAPKRTPRRVAQGRTKEKERERERGKAPKPEGMLFLTDIGPTDDGDPWVDTDSVDGSEFGFGAGVGFDGEGGV